MGAALAGALYNSLAYISALKNDGDDCSTVGLAVGPCQTKVRTQGRGHRGQADTGARRTQADTGAIQFKINGPLRRWELG